MKPGDSIRVAYGADLSPDRLVVARCEKVRHGCSCVVIYDGALPLSGEALNRLRGEEQRLDVCVAGALSPHMAFARWVHTPLNSIEKSLRVLPSLLDVQIPFAVEQCELAAAQVRREENRAVSILAVASRRDDIRKVLEEYEAAGLTPDLLDHEGLALWSQSFREHAKVGDGPRVVACMRRHAVTLVVGEGDRDHVLAAQRFRVGVADLNDTARGAQLCRELAAKVRQLLLVHVPDRLDPHSVAWFWCGMVEEKVRKALETELRVIGPPVFFVHDRPESFLARALATRAALGESAECNLLKGRMTPAKEKRRMEKRCYRAAAWAAAAGLSMLFSAAALRWVPTLQSRALEASIAAVTKDITGLRRIPRGQEMLLVRRALEEKADTDAVLRRCARDDVAERLEGWLMLCAKYEAEVEWMALQRDNFLARGTFKDWNDGEAFIPWLEKEGYEVSLSRKDADADGRVAFALNATRHRGGNP